MRKPNKIYTAQKVTGDWTQDVYNCFTAQEHWNGWAMPYFQKDEALRIAKEMGDVVYDELTDTFVWTCSEDKDVYEPCTIAVDGKFIKAYPIGTGFWCWDLVLPTGDLKVYVAFWSKEAFGEHDETRQVEESFFSEDKCYSPDDIAGIHALKISETWKSNHYGDYHTVKRVI
jgi:hypothetical protein